MDGGAGFDTIGLSGGASLNLGSVPNVDVGTGDAGAEAGFQEGGNGADPGQAEKQQNGQIQGSKGVNHAPKNRSGAAFLTQFSTFLFRQHLFHARRKRRQDKGGRYPQVIPRSFHGPMAGSGQVGGKERMICP